eukprot:scaffold130401_cov32-Tisochrysis_lutea.AAC.3
MTEHGRSAGKRGTANGTRAAKSERAVHVDKSKNEGSAASEKTSSNTRLRVKDPLRYKTVMCENWAAKGSCPYSHKCQFAHGEHELRPKQAGEKRRGRSASISKSMSPLSSPTSPSGSAEAADRKRTGLFGAPGFDAFSDVPAPSPAQRPPSPLLLPHSWLPTWGPRDPFLNDLRSSSPRTYTNVSPSASLDSQLTAPLTPRMPYSLSAFGSGDWSNSHLLPMAHTNPLCMPSPPLSPTSAGPLLVSPLLPADALPTDKWPPVRVADDDEPLMCNPVTGVVEITPRPPNVRAREASHNTLSVRRSISMLWNDDDRELGERSAMRVPPATTSQAKVWGWGPGAPPAATALDTNLGYGSCFTSAGAQQVSLSPRSSNYSSAVEDECDDSSLSMSSLPPASATAAHTNVPTPALQCCGTPAMAPAAFSPGLTDAWLKGRHDRDLSQGAENVARQFDYLFRGLNTISAQ